MLTLSGQPYLLQEVCFLDYLSAGAIASQRAMLAHSQLQSGTAFCSEAHERMRVASACTLNAYILARTEERAKLAAGARSLGCYATKSCARV